VRGTFKKSALADDYDKSVSLCDVELIRDLLSGEEEIVDEEEVGGFLKELVYGAPKWLFVVIQNCEGVTASNVVSLKLAPTITSLKKFLTALKKKKAAEAQVPFWTPFVKQFHALVEILKVGFEDPRAPKDAWASQVEANWRIVDEVAQLKTLFLHYTLGKEIKKVVDVFISASVQDQAADTLHDGVCKEVQVYHGKGVFEKWAENRLMQKQSSALLKEARTKMVGWTTNLTSAIDQCSFLSMERYLTGVTSVVKHGVDLLGNCAAEWHFDMHGRLKYVFIVGEVLVKKDTLALEDGSQHDAGDDTEQGEAATAAAGAAGAAAGAAGGAASEGSGDDVEMAEGEENRSAAGGGSQSALAETRQATDTDTPMTAFEALKFANLYLSENGKSVKSSFEGLEMFASVMTESYRNKADAIALQAVVEKKSEFEELLELSKNLLECAEGCLHVKTSLDELLDKGKFEEAFRAWTAWKMANRTDKDSKQDQESIPKLAHLSAALTTLGCMKRAIASSKFDSNPMLQLATSFGSSEAMMKASSVITTHIGNATKVFEELSHAPHSVR
jgi:hypothetical protein